LYVASITQHNVTMLVSPSESKVSEEDRAQFTYKWKAAVARGIWQNCLQKFSTGCYIG